MEEWKEYRLGDVIEFKTGKLNSNAAISKGKYPFFTCSPEVLSINEYAFDQKAILLAGNNAEGNFNIKYYEGKFNAYQRTYVINPTTENVDIKYLYYCLGLSLKSLKSISQGTSTKFLTATIINNLPIKLPSIRSQKQIISILSSLDNKIELNRRINENLEQQAQALFKSWFVDFEPFKDGKFVNSELGMIPEGWRVGTIGDYCKIRSGFAFKSSWWTEKGVKIVKIKNISSSGILNMDDCSYVSKENVSKAKEFSLKPGDILIAMTGATIGKFCLVPALKEEMYVNQRVGKFFLGENPIMKIPFIHGLLKCENIISQIINKGQGSAQPNISGNDIETIPIIYPPEDIISKYNELVSPYFSMIIENISACDFISQLRDTLLPRLMSGELAITDVDDRSIFQ